MHDIIIVGIVFTAIVMIIKSALDHALRMKLIDRGLVGEPGKGVDLRLIHSTEPSLKWGIVLVCVGVVLFVMEAVPTVFTEEVVLGVVLTTAGVALLAHYAIAEYRSRKLKEHQSHVM